ncbi:GNAT family N-acetyltransferase [Streptomyces leeuwenhoekii]|uniref:GNAT family N-acetyltransferase n=1 Tax=Streptomyces leeuwenhoekii TaxID=1437453 RepID=UPI0036A157F3
MPNPLPRLAVPADAPDVLTLLGQVPAWRESSLDRWRERLQDQAEFGDRARRGVWVLEAGGRVRGVATVQWRSPKTVAGRTWPVYLEYLVVDEKHRGRGYGWGGRLEGHVTGELARLGHAGAYLHVFKEDPGWAEALGFWEHRGWTQAAGTRDSHILMTKETPVSPRPDPGRP